MQIDKVNKVIISEPLVVHRVRKVEADPTEEISNYIRISPVIVYEATYDSKGNIGPSIRMFSAYA